MLRLIWLLSDGSTPEISSTANEKETQKQLQDQVKLPVTFDNILDCPVSLRSSLTSSEKNILIIHADLADGTLPEVHHLCHVVCIFVYLDDFQKNFSEKLTQFVNKFKKVIVVKQDDLVKRIEAFKQRWHRNLYDSFSLSIAPGDRIDRSATTINGGFVFSQLLVHILLRMKPLPHDREEFCDQCIKVFQKTYEFEKNEVLLKNRLGELRQFQEDIYRDDAVLRWYTKDSFLYRILNESLRTDDVGMLFHSRYIIRELNEQLIKRQYNSPVRVYRGQQMSNVEAELLGKSVGQLVYMKSFLSTSLDLEKAEMYANAEAHSNTEEIAIVLFIIDAIPSENNKRLRPFADITEISHFGESENEILFMLGSVFCIKNVEQDVNKRWIVSMTACDQEDIELNKLFSWFEDRQNINGTDDETFHSFGNLLLGMGMPYETEQLYRHMLNEYKLFPPDDNELARCYHMLGKAELVAELAEGANSWWEKPLNRGQSSNDDNCRNERSKKILDHLRRAKSKFFHSSRETTPASSSHHSYQRSHFDNALKRFEKALFYAQKTFLFDYFLAASIHHSSANTYRALRDYKNALTDYENALLYYKACFGEEHRLIAEIYTDLGRMYYEKKQLDKALDYYIRGLTVAQKILPNTHPEMGVFHTGIAVVYSQMGKIDEAKFHFEAIANMDLTSFPNENHPLCTYYEALYIFYSHKSTIHRTPMTEIPNVQQHYMQRSGIMFYRCPWCYSYVWIYKAFFFCKGSPCFRCLKQLLTLRPPRLNSRFLQYLDYIDKYVRLLKEDDVDDLFSRELRQQYLRSFSDQDSIEPR